MELPKTDLFELTTPTGGKFKTTSENEAFDFVKRIATEHYENFPVGSFLIPASKRKYVYAVYAFARIADDIADELLDVSAEERIATLDKLTELIETESEELKNPIIRALKTTMTENAISPVPLKNLLTAFKMDVDFKAPDTFDDLLSYSSYSANPVGEIVLKIFDEYNLETAIHSDFVCTGLQLINFWQDISVDLGKKRLFIPKDYLNKYDLNLENLQKAKNSANFDKCLKELIAETKEVYDKGTNLPSFIKNARLKLEMKATILGGKKMLKKIENTGAEIIEKRPKLKTSDFWGIFVKSLFSY